MRVSFSLSLQGCYLYTFVVYLTPLSCLLIFLLTALRRYNENLERWDNLLFAADGKFSASAARGRQKIFAPHPDEPANGRSEQG